MSPDPAVGYTARLYEQTDDGELTDPIELFRQQLIVAVLLPVLATILRSLTSSAIVCSSGFSAVSVPAELTRWRISDLTRRPEKI